MGKQERQKNRVKRTKEEAKQASRERAEDLKEYQRQEKVRQEREKARFTVSGEFDKSIAPAVIFIGSLEALISYNLTPKPLNKDISYPNNYHFFEGLDLKNNELINKKLEYFLSKLLQNFSYLSHIVLPLLQIILKNKHKNVQDGEVVGYVNNYIDEGLLNILVWIENQAVSMNYTYFLETTFKNFIKSEITRPSKKPVENNHIFTTEEKILVQKLTFNYPQEIIGFNFKGDDFQVQTNNGPINLKDIENHVIKQKIFESIS